jgi:hypothetical protein
MRQLFVGSSLLSKSIASVAYILRESLGSPLFLRASFALTELVRFRSGPTAYAAGWVLSPLRGWFFRCPAETHIAPIFVSDWMSRIASAGALALHELVQDRALLRTAKEWPSLSHDSRRLGHFSLTNEKLPMDYGVILKITPSPLLPPFMVAP